MARRIAAALMALAIVAASHEVRQELDDDQKITTCFEDMPCWDCHTMGNHVCGKDHR